MDAVHDYIGLRLEFSGETFLDITGGRSYWAGRVGRPIFWPR